MARIRVEFGGVTRGDIIYDGLMRFQCVVAMLFSPGGLAAVELPDLASVPVDLEVPAAAQGAPAPGRRVLAVAAGFEGGMAHHTLYLPMDWRAGELFPVIVEYPGADRASSLERLGRLGSRPQFIVHEGSTAETGNHLRSAGVEASFTFQPVPFRNHSDRWVLRDIPARRAARDWLARVTALRAPASQTGTRPRGSAASPP